MPETTTAARTYYGHPIIFDCPGYTIYEAPDHRTFKHGDKIAIPYRSMRGDTLHRFYTLGNIWGCAVNWGLDVGLEVARSKSLGHDQYWASQNGVTISDPPQAKSAAPGFNFGDIIKFQGRRFRLTATPNGNCGLVEVIDFPEGCDEPNDDADAAQLVRDAAPELLAQLKQCLANAVARRDAAKIYRDAAGNPSRADCQSEVDAIRAVIAKAEGRS